MKQKNAKVYRYIVKKRFKELVILAILTVLSSIAEVASIGSILPLLGVLTSPEQVFSYLSSQQLINKLGIKDAKDLLIPTALMFCTICILAAAVRITTIWYRNKTIYKIGADISEEIYTRTLYQPYKVQTSRNSSVIIDAIATKVGVVISGVLQPLVILISNATVILFIITPVVIYYHITAIGVLAGYGAVYYGIYIANRKRIKNNGKEISILSTKLMKSLQESIGGIRNVIMENAQKYYCRQYQDADLKIRMKQAENSTASETPRYAVEALSMVFLIFVAVQIGVASNSNSLAITILGMIVLAAQRILPLIQQIYHALALMAGSRHAAEEIVTLLEQPMPKDVDTTRVYPMPFERNIELRDISFRYSEKEPWILRKINIVIPKGSRVGIIGPSGCGKSTFLDIFMALLQPSEGKLIVDGQEITNRNSTSWQRKIGHVPQSVFLADATIAENIAYGEPIEKIDMNRVKYSAERAQLSSTIKSDIDGYDGFVGEQGARISGGQRQRIGVARAFYKKAEILVFDEATNALDNHTEEEVINEIERIDRATTVIMVTHRPQNLKNFDIIVELPKLEEGQMKREPSK